MNEVNPDKPRSCPAERPRLRVSWGAVTHTGLVREHNEDAFLASSPVFLVADGMGGHRLGDQASRLALSSFEHLVGQEFVDSAELERCLSRAAAEVSALGHDAVAPGSTLTGTVLSLQGQRPCLRVLNIGDSRTYQLSSGVFGQVTRDHSHVQDLVDAGFISPEQARKRPDRSVITRALGAGAGPVVRVDQTLLPAVQGDRFLICSDGLSGQVRDAALAQVLLSHQDPQAAAERLLELALGEGGQDNITVVVVDLLEVSPSWSDAEPDGSGSHGFAPDDTVPTPSVSHPGPEEA